jgi:hypothetical protein
MFGLFKKNPAGGSGGKAGSFSEMYAIPSSVEVRLYSKKENLNVNVSVKDGTGLDADQIKYIIGEIPALMSTIEDKVRDFVENNYSDFLDKFYGENFDLDDEQYWDIKEDYYNQTKNAVDKALHLLTPTIIYFDKSDVGVLNIYANEDAEYYDLLKVNINLQREVTVEYDMM